MKARGPGLAIVLHSPSGTLSTHNYHCILYLSVDVYLVWFEVLCRAILKDDCSLSQQIWFQFVSNYFITTARLELVYNISAPVETKPLYHLTAVRVNVWKEVSILTGTQEIELLKMLPHRCWKTCLNFKQHPGWEQIFLNVVCYNSVQ